MFASNDRESQSVLQLPHPRHARARLCQIGISVADRTETTRRQLSALADEYLHVLPRRGRRRDPFYDDFYPLESALERLRHTYEITEFLRTSRRDPYVTFRDTDQILSDAWGGLVNTREVLNKSGALALFDDHLEFVMRRLDRVSLPRDEVDLLTALGFSRLASDVPDVVAINAAEWRIGSAPGQSLAREYRQRPATMIINLAITRVEQHQSERRETLQQDGDGDGGAKGPPPDRGPRKERRWWKGLGKIVEGAALATADVGLALGAFKIPAHGQAEFAGVVVSIGGGIGRIMSGIGDLSGE
jgi:hypothetical protein